MDEELRRERDALREELERLKRMVDVCSDWLWQIDANGVYTDVGPQIRQFLGYEPEEALGKTPFDFMTADEARRIAGEFARILESRAPFRAMENVNVHKDGSLVYLETSGFPLFDAAGQFVGYHGMDRDVTSARRAEIEHERLKDEIIRAQEAALAELSTPLIPLTERVVVMPLVGTVDARRLELIMETLLTGVTTRNAAAAILDITGVPHVDTHVANGLAQTARALRLVGAQVVLTGIRPDVARVLVQLGVDLAGIVTCRTLQEGIARVSELGSKR